MPQIAKGAAVSPSTVYVYFPSKLKILFAIYDPWLRERLERLDAELSKIAVPRARLHRIFEALWRDIPAEDGGFARNVMQALSTATSEEGYDPTLVIWAKAKLASMIKETLECAGVSPAGTAELAQISFMAFDGFALNQRLDSGAKADTEIVDLVCTLLLGAKVGSTERSVGQPQFLNT